MNELIKRLSEVADNIQNSVIRLFNDGTNVRITGVGKGIDPTDVATMRNLSELSSGRPYETLHYEIDCDISGVLTTTLKIDTSGGTITTIFTYGGPGTYNCSVTTPTNSTPVLGVNTSSAKSSTYVLGVYISSNNTPLGLFNFRVQDPITGNNVNEWFNLQLTIFVKN